MVQSEMIPSYYFKGNSICTVYGGVGKEELGTTLKDAANGKYVKLSKKQLEFYKNNPSSSIKEIFYKKLDNTATDIDRRNAISYLLSYDNSPEVNTFYINGTPLWMNKNYRSSLREALKILNKRGAKTFSLFTNDRTYEIDIVILEEILDSVEWYAMNCLIATNKLKQKIKSAKTKEDIKEILNTMEYPEKLRFEV